jgi:hypothetical protein
LPLIQSLHSIWFCSYGLEGRKSDVYFKAREACLYLGLYLPFENDEETSRYIRDGALRIHPLHRNQNAYQVSKSTETALHNVVTRIENAIQHKAFLHIEGAFDSTSFDTIIQAVGRHGIESAICRCNCAMLENRNISATLSVETHKVSAARGCPQRKVLSPLLWNLLVDDLIWGLNNDGYYKVGYADNIAILLNGKFLHTVSEVLQRALYIVQQWCDETNFILGLDILRAYIASVDIVR